MKYISCVYKILNKLNNKCYIGSTRDFNKRWETHLRQLRNGRHHSVYLQRAWDKYGANNFSIEVVELTKPKDLFKKEKIWIDKLSPAYNLGSVGGGDNISKHPNREEICKKHSANGKRRWSGLSQDEYKNACDIVSGAKNPNWKGGISKPKCQICGIDLSYGAELCNKHARTGEKNSFYGKTHSEESKNKMRQKRMGILPANTLPVTINGVSYPSQAKAAKALGVSGGTITNWLRGMKPFFQTYKNLNTF